MPLQIGIDLGGSKIEAAVLDADGNFLFRQRLPTQQQDYPATLRTLQTLVAAAEAALGCHFDAVGIGHPGSINPADGRVRNANSTCLNGQTLAHDVNALLQRRIRLANDADCLALSEAVDGAARGYATVFGVILGTGVGGGWVVNGQLVQGPNGLSGEWGHNPLPVLDADELPGPPCYCGRHGCIEAWLSGPALVADYYRGGGQTAISGVPALLALADDGDTRAATALERHTVRLARALGSIINAIDPQAIVLGGGVAQRPGLIAALNAALSAHVFLPPGTPLNTVLLLPQFGDSSGVRGAARLV